ncbi:MAG: hypothetical protein V4484_20125 [Pseudomonadota bacterium]
MSTDQDVSNTGPSAATDAGYVNAATRAKLEWQRPAIVSCKDIEDTQGIFIFNGDGLSNLT